MLLNLDVGFWNHFLDATLGIVNDWDLKVWLGREKGQGNETQE